MKNYQIKNLRKMELKQINLKIISLGNEAEFYHMISNMMTASKALSSNDIDNLHIFIECAVPHFQ